MKFELSPESVNLVKSTLNDIGIPDTIDNRQKLVKLIFDTGFSQVFFCAGLSCRFDEEFPRSSIGKIGPYDEDDEEPETAQGPQFAPDPCPNCGKTPRHNGREWACNCQTYSVGPKPITPCPHCGVKLRPNHYYWECDCNRYDEAPEGIPVEYVDGTQEIAPEPKEPFIPPEWSGKLSNSFPTE